MSVLKRLWPQARPTMETIRLGPAAKADSCELPGAPHEQTIKKEVPPPPSGAAELAAEERAGLERSVAAKWFFNDILYIAMLLLALVGVIFRLPLIYWIVLSPIFGLISIVEGWSHFSTRSERLGLAYGIAAIWGALLAAIYLLYNSSVQGVLDANATSLAMIIVLALGTFVAGVQARVWQISAVGGFLFLATPGVGWLDQSPLLLTAVAIVVVGLGGFVWWVSQTQSTPASGLDLAK